MSDAASSRRQTGLPSEALGAPPGPRSVFFKVLSAGLSGALLVLLFAAILPKIADFGGVWDSVKAMKPGVVVLLFIGAVAIRVVLAEAYSVLTPNLPLSRSLIAREASTAVSNVIPGPSGTAAQFVILHSWGVSAERFARATIAISVVNNVTIFAAPGLLWLVWALLGMPAGDGSSHAWAFGILALVVSVLTIVVVTGVVRSTRLARALGAFGQACVNPFRRLTSKEPISTWPDACVALRDDTVAQLRAHGTAVLACGFGAYALNGALLVGCLWACGVSRDLMPFSLGFLLYSIGRLATVVSITPGGVGVVEIVYTAVYVAVLGESAHDAVVAGVLVYRAFTYLLPIISGAFGYVIWRVMRRRELHADKVASRDAAADQERTSTSAGQAE